MSEPEQSNAASETGGGGPGVVERFRPLLRTAWERISWRWLLVALVPVVAVVVADVWGATWFYEKELHERIAIPVLAIAAAVWLGRTVRERSVFIGLIAAQALVFLLREIHFGWTKDGVYVLTGIVGVVGLVLTWRADWQAILPRIDWRLISALATTVACYALALAVQRRAFKGIPGEDRLHIAFEEVLETWAHLWFLASAFVRGRSKPSEE